MIYEKLNRKHPQNKYTKMFLYYSKQNEITYDTFKSVNSVTEVLTSMGLLVWNNFDFNIIFCALLFLLLITVLKNSNK